VKWFETDLTRFESVKTASLVQNEVNYRDWMHPKNRYGNPKALIDHLIKNTMTDRVEVLVFSPEAEQENE
jgi:hypothetical protein